MSFHFKYLNLVLIMAGAIASLLFIGPHYEAAVDLTLVPPENLRRTDFNWITINEWFASQAHMISSHNTLKDVKSDLTEKELKRIIRARRIGAADVMRILARGNERPDRLVKSVGDVSIAYLKGLAQQACVTQDKNTINGIVSSDSDQEAERVKGELSARYNSYAKLEIEIKKLSKALIYKKTELIKAMDSAKDLPSMESALSSIESNIASLTMKRSELKSTYTDNWPEVATLNKQIAELEEKRRSTSSRLEQAFRNEREARTISVKVEEEEKKLADMKKKLQTIDLQLSMDVTKAPEAKIEPDRLRDNLCGFGYVINPPAVTLLPFLRLHIICGAIIGIIIWLILEKLLESKKP